MLALIDQDGPEPDDAERAKRRSVTFGKQQPDGMVALIGNLDPQAWATWEPIIAKFAAPGMCNPDDDHPRISGTPTQAQIDDDHRTLGQRQHDAMTAIARLALTSGDLGHHNGLPVSVIITTTLQDLHAAAGLPDPDDPDDTDATDATPATPAPDATSGVPATPTTRPVVPTKTSSTALTAGGSLLPISDLIKMASHAIHYLVVFDEHTNQVLYCGRGKRIAPAAHRIVLYARDRGCTKPGCTVPAYGTQVHHTNGWANDGHTNIDEETLACGPDNRLAEHGWTHHIGPHGVEWIPPPHLDTGQPRINHYHHPERLLTQTNSLPGAETKNGPPRAGGRRVRALDLRSRGEAPQQICRRPTPKHDEQDWGELHDSGTAENDVSAGAAEGQSEGGHQP